MSDSSSASIFSRYLPPLTEEVGLVPEHAGGNSRPPSVSAKMNWFGLPNHRLTGGFFDRPFGGAQTEHLPRRQFQAGNMLKDYGTWQVKRQADASRI